METTRVARVEGLFTYYVLVSEYGVHGDGLPRQGVVKYSLQEDPLFKKSSCTQDNAHKYASAHTTHHTLSL